MTLPLVREPDAVLSDAVSPRVLALEAGRARHLLLALAFVLALLVLAVPVLEAPPAPLTSDESLYLAEAYNIAKGRGATYPSGELVTHRAPLYPALLAAPMRITGDVESAYWVPKLTVLALAGASFLLAQQLFGTLAGTLAALLAMSNAFLRWLGTTLYLDSVETLFLLLLLAALWRALQTQSVVWFAGAGLLFGAAFLTKEAAVQWLPLPFAFVLLSSEHRNRRVARGLAAYAAASGATLAGWVLWVYLATGRLYFWGTPDARLIALAEALLAGAAGLGIAWLLLRRLAPGRVGQMAFWLGIVLAAGWAVLVAALLEHASWPYPAEHWRTVPGYLWEVAAPNSQPWPLVGLGALWLCLRARRDGAARLLALALLLFLPFAALVANRSLAYRDVLPVLYLAYAGAGALGALVLRRAADRTGPVAVGGVALAGLTLLGVTQTQQLLDERLPYDEAAVSQTNWDNPLVHSTADWLHDHVPPNARVMSSRLYYSQLYVLDGAAHPIDQLPTVRVEPRPGERPFLEPVATMFRWEDHRLQPAVLGEPWLYVRRYPEKGYYVALSERDLLRDLRERETGYLVLTGEDAGYSSFTYLDYFLKNPAFELIHADQRPTSGAYVFRVRRDRLGPRPYRAVVSHDTLRALSQETGLPEHEVTSQIDADGVTVRP